MDLLADAARGIAHQLASAGVEFDEAQVSNDVLGFLVAYYAFRGRWIEAQPRRVALSRELLASPSWMRHESALRDLQARFFEGKPIHPFQSKRIVSFDARDPLLFDWNIHHLHLGALKEGELFCGRTDDLLYLLLARECVYFLAVLDHRSFADTELLEILDSNWPFVLEPFVVRGTIPPDVPTTSESVNGWRKARANILITLKSGKMLLGPGGGQVMSGMSMRFMRSAMRTAELLRNVEEHIRDNAPEVCRVLGLSEVEEVRLDVLEPTRAVVRGAGPNPARLEIPVLWSG